MTGYNGATMQELEDELMKLIRSKMVDDPHCQRAVRRSARELSQDYRRAMQNGGDGYETVWYESKRVLRDDQWHDELVEHRRTFCVAVSSTTKLRGNPNDLLAIESALCNVMVLSFDLELRLKLVARLLPYVNRRATQFEVERNCEGKVLVTVSP